MKREIACIVCPGSCILAVEYSNNDVLDVIGHKCEQGIAFAKKEMNDPERILTTTVKLSSGGLLPVRSNAMVKKSEVKSLVRQLKSVVVVPPVEIAQVIVTDMGFNSVDIVATDAVR